MASLEKGSGTELVFLQSRPFTNRKHLEHHKMKNLTTKVQDCWAILHQTRAEQHSSKTPETGLLTSQTFTDICSKKRGCYAMGKHRPVPSFSKYVAAVKVKMSFFPWNCKISQFQHLICFSLCSVGSKIWVYKIGKSLRSAFIYISHSVPILEFGL